ncbi:MAG: PAS domain S-box protein [Clostridia bacterium]|nr:PAS domain S-box protein [Clostridia bacterium]
MKRCDQLLKHLDLTAKQMYNQSQQVGHVGTWLYACGTGDYWWSDQVYRIYGLPKSTRLRSVLFMDQVLEEDRPLAREMFQRAMAGRPYRFVHRVLVHGKIKWLEQRGRLYSGPKYPVPYVVGMVRDVTALKEAESRLDSRRAGFAAITSYLAETTDTTDLSAIVSSVKRTIRKRMDAALIAVFARQGDQVFRVIPKGKTPMQAFLFQDIHDFVGYRAATEGRKVILPVSDYPSPLGREALTKLGGQTVIALPIRFGHSAIGALTIITKRGGDLNREEGEFCRTICGYLGSQLNNAMLYDRLRQELALRKRLESDREVIFEESVDFITIIDKHGRFAQINPAFAARLGHPAEVLIGQSVFDYIHPEDRPYAHRIFCALPKTGVYRGFRNRFLCRNGEVGYLENNLKYMSETGSTIAIARDLTGQREMEERNISLEQSIAMEKLKSEFFAGLSHEFKTPLNIILSTLDLVRMKSMRENEDRFREGYSKFFDYAYQNCYKLLRLTSNLLDSSCIDSQYYRLHPTSVRLDELLRSTVQAAEIYANARGVSLSFSSPCGSPLLVCDRDSVERILLNLLSNAIKNTLDGGWVRVTLTEESGFFRVTVEDSGVGIPPEAIPVIFEKFRTSRNPLSGQREGSGIGLSLVKSLTELHGGAVTVESQVGVGSRFSFTLANRLSPAPGRQPPDSGHESHARLELSDLK